MVSIEKVTDKLEIDDAYVYSFFSHDLRDILEFKKAVVDRYFHPS
mgnify:CR=1 FL=1